MRQEIRFAGYGGQGIALMAMLLGKAVAIYEKKEAVFTQSYGPESRGGASSADVVTSEMPIDFPLVLKPDLLVAMFQEAYNRYRPLLKKDGLLFIDQDLVKPQTHEKKIFRIPATRIAKDMGKPIVANVVMLGFFSALSGITRLESVEEAIKNTVQPKFIDLNIAAFKEGVNWAKEKVLTAKPNAAAVQSYGSREPFEPEFMENEAEREGIWGE